MKKLLIIIMLVLAMLACNLPTPTPTPEPTVTPTPVVIVVTATPAPIDPSKDIITGPPSFWMDLEIKGRFPGAEIWPPVGVQRGIKLYRIFNHDGQDYMAIFEQGEEMWELVDVVEINATSTPEPSEYMKDT